MKLPFEYDHIKCLGELTQIWAFNEELLYQYQISSMPGNSKIGITSRVWLHPRLRGRGIGSQPHQIRLLTAQEKGYQRLLCTVNNSNEAELAILRKFNWSCIWPDITNGVSIWSLGVNPL